MKTIVGNYVVCLLGKTLNCYYHNGYNYLQIDVDIGSSAIVRHNFAPGLGCVMVVTVDMGFLVEAQLDEELPERLFGAIKICQMEVDSATFVDNAMPSKKVLPCEDASENEDE
ncbi:Protein of unknown function (DUF1336) [Abeliophyllum distichum]|uniref:Protein ENHANCED DISEASE RESISTANCE 2 C-terminal domain-containing protein n=1 Tax=Abeliophyllum distichum TaxID=126358 RepID=A0ABD1VXH7_9LAMI